MTKSPDPTRDSRVAVVDNALSDALRTVLHQTEFQNLEALWRGMDMILRRIETGPSLQVLLVAVLFVVGSLLPREHRATCRANFGASAETLFAVLVDVEAHPSWRTGVKSVRRIEPVDGKPAFVEESSQGSIRFVVEASEPPRRLVTRVADDTLPYGGTWTFALVPGAAGTTLAITEDGFVDPALFRALARFVFGHHSTMERYLADLATKLGETATVERVE